MESLVADYSSDSERSNDSNDICSTDGRKEATTADIKTSNFLLQDDASSHSDTDNEVEDRKCIESEETQVEHQAARLPNPLALGTSSKLQSPSFVSETYTEIAKHSVFLNPFQKAEKAKLSVLEQHVKMTNEPIADDHTKKLCRSFMKGKCRFGKKCKYFHPKDIVNTGIAESESSQEKGGSASQHGYYGQQSYDSDVQQEVVDDDSYMGQLKRKHRAGINDHLRPPSKAMKNLNQQRSKERPWTMNN